MRIRNVSLLGLLAIVSCVAVSVSHVITSLRLARANTELASLRQRLELIAVEDTDRIAARRLPSSDEYVRRWAVRLPDAGSKLLYANWGSSQLSAICDITAKSTHQFRLAPDPDTHETTVTFRVQRNPHDPQWGSVHIQSGPRLTTIATNPEITSLLMGETPCWSEAIGDSPTTRSASSPITLFAIEARDDPKSAFCLWLDEPKAAEDG